MGAAVEFIDTTYAGDGKDMEEEGEEEEEEKCQEDYRKEMMSMEDAKLKEKELGELAVNHLGESQSMTVVILRSVAKDGPDYF
jgi:hypothetical protein